MRTLGPCYLSLNYFIKNVWNDSKHNNNIYAAKTALVTSYNNLNFRDDKIQTQRGCSKFHHLKMTEQNFYINA